MMQSPMFPVMLSERFECQRLKSRMRPQTSSLHLLLTLRPPSSAACLQRLLLQATRQRWVILAAPSRWKVYPGFPIGLPWVPVFPAVFVRFPHIKRSPVGSRVFSGFHSSCYDPKRCTLGSRRNKRSPWVPCPIEVDGGSWRTGAQENTAVRAHGRRFTKKGMCRMRRGYASSGGLAQVLQMQGSGALTHHVFQGAQRSMRRRESHL